MEHSRVPLFRLLGRALRRRCPVCGGRPIFLSWTRLCPGCPVCGFQLQRGERGYWVGAHFLNLLAVDAVFAAWFGGLLIATWPDTPWTLLHVGSVAVMLITPLAFFPWSKTIFLALDLFFRPPEPGDYESRAERSPVRDG